MKRYFEFVQSDFEPVKDELNPKLCIDFEQEVKNHFMFLFRKEELQNFLSERNIKVNIL